MRKRLAGVLIAIGGCGLFAAPANAEQIVAVGAGLGNTSPTVRIVEFVGNTVVQAPVPITGYANPATERISGVDYRPATGVLYAVTIDTSQVGRLYTLDSVTGVLSRVNATQTYALGLELHQEVGIDFNPTSDQLRVVSDADVNLSINPTTAVATTQTPVAYPGAGDPGSGRDPAITAVAYSNNRAGATGTTLYDMDVDANSANEELDLVVQRPPASGSLATIINECCIFFDDEVGMDISPLGPLYFAGSNPRGNQTEVFRLPDPTTIDTFVASDKITIRGTEIVSNIAVVPVPSQLAVDDVTVREGDTATVTVSRSAQGDGAGLSVDYATAAGTAGAADFAPANGTLMFAPGDNRETFTVATTEDVSVESDEAFAVNLSNPSRTAQILDGSAAITIADDDVAPAPDPAPTQTPPVAPAADPTPPVAPDTSPPDTNLTQAPKPIVRAKKTVTARFAFSSNESGATFQCRIDGDALASCASPVAKTVGKGAHTFEVRAIDAAGNLDPFPARAEFTVKKRKRKK